MEYEHQDIQSELNKERNSRTKLESQMDLLQKDHHKMRSVKIEQEDTLNRLKNELEITKTRLNTEIKEKDQLNLRLESMNQR